MEAVERLMDWTQISFNTYVPKPEESATKLNTEDGMMYIDLEGSGQIMVSSNGSSNTFEPLITSDPCYNNISADSLVIKQHLTSVDAKFTGTVSANQVKGQELDFIDGRVDQLSTNTIQIEDPYNYHDQYRLCGLVIGNVNVTQLVKVLPQVFQNLGIDPNTGYSAQYSDQLSFNDIGVTVPSINDMYALQNMFGDLLSRVSKLEEKLSELQ